MIVWNLQIKVKVSISSHCEWPTRSVCYCALPICRIPEQDPRMTGVYNCGKGYSIRQILNYGCPILSIKGIYIWSYECSISMVFIEFAMPSEMNVECLQMLILLSCHPPLSWCSLWSVRCGFQHRIGSTCHYLENRKLGLKSSSSPHIRSKGTAGGN